MTAIGKRRSDRLLARALQHEIDPLDGILFVTRRRNWKPPAGRPSNDRGTKCAPCVYGNAGIRGTKPAGHSKAGFTVCAVVTQPDRPKGWYALPPPVACFQELQLPVYQPEKVRDATFVQQFKTWRRIA